MRSLGAFDAHLFAKARDATTGAREAAFVGSDRAQTPEADADALIAAFRVRALPEASRRQRQARARESAGQWSYVAKIIARRGGRQPCAEPSTLTAIDADRESSPAPGPFAEVRPLEELERILDARPQNFRLQFFSVATERGPTIVAETEIRAADATGAIREAADAHWPAQAIGLRVLDREGREIFEQLKADRH
jgi:hypothetical protein